MGITTVRADDANGLPAVISDHNKPLGTTNGTLASLLVPSGTSIESDVAPHDGMVAVFIPAITVRVRKEANALANVNDPAYVGPWVWHWPIKGGERISLLGDGDTGTATVAMVE